MKYGKIVNGMCEDYYHEDEDAILDEAYNRLDDKLKKKFDAYEEGYGTYFKDFEQWFERYASQIWSDVLDEVQDEKNEAEDIIRRQDEEMEREARVYGSYDEQVDREYYRDRI